MNKRASPTRGKPRSDESVTGRVAALDVGEIHTISACLGNDPDTTFAQFVRNGLSWRNRLRNRVVASVTAARKRTGHSYRTEIATTVTPGSRVYLVLFITRTE